MRRVCRAVDLKFHAADDYEDSISVEIGMRPDNLIVIGMNGPKHCPTSMVFRPG